MLFLSGYYEGFKMLICVQYCWYYGNYHRNLKNMYLTSASDRLVQPLRKDWLVEWVID
jgi:hypothetical protein